MGVVKPGGRSKRKPDDLVKKPSQLFYPRPVVVLPASINQARSGQVTHVARSTHLLKKMLF
jgi:hypothetical protein